MHLQFPFGFDRRGRSARTGDAAHIRQMIEQVLFTSPGERVNRPTFGSGVQQLVFETNGTRLAAAVQANVHASLQLWLGDLIDVRQLEVQAVDSRLTITINYIINRTSEQLTDTFERSAVG